MLGWFRAALRRVRAPLGMGLALALYNVVRPWFAPHLGLPAAIRLLAPAQSMRVATFNLRNLGEDTQQNVARLRERVTQLRADVIAVQEVHSRAHLQAIAPEASMVLSRGGGIRGQRVGFVYRPTRVTPIGPAREFDGLTENGRLRPALAQRFQCHACKGAPQVWMVVVHLKAMRIGYKTRTAQVEALRTWLAQTIDDDAPLVLLGDFNLTGNAAVSPARERDARATQLSMLGLALAPVRFGCTAYWEGRGFDGWHEPSWLDAMWTRGFQPTQAIPLGACGRTRCNPVRHSEPYPDEDLGPVSDHCPVVLDLQPTM